MIEVYVKDNENYESNGDMVLTPTSCEMELRMEGVAEITLEHPVDELGRWEYLVNDNVIAAPTPYSKKQLFRIYDHVKTESGVTAYARHIFYDSAGEVLLDVRPTKKTGQEALDIILSGTKYKAKSDIKKQSTAYYVRKNVMEAIAGDDERTNRRTAVTIPMIKSKRNAARNTRFAPTISPSAIRSETSLEIAVGSPAEDMTSSQE